MAQEGRFRYDPRCAPGGVLPGHAANQITDFACDRRASRFSSAGFPPPIQLESLAVPAERRASAAGYRSFVRTETMNTIACSGRLPRQSSSTKSRCPPSDQFSDAHDVSYGSKVVFMQLDLHVSSPHFTARIAPTTSVSSRPCLTADSPKTNGHLFKRKREPNGLPFQQSSIALWWTTIFPTQLLYTSQWFCRICAVGICSTNA